MEPGHHSQNRETIVCPRRHTRSPVHNQKTLMPRRHLSGWVLCDFHIHTQWSDGLEHLETVVDLYGQNGFDAICITDHVVDAEFWRIHPQARAIARHDFDRLPGAPLERGRRAWDKYGMLLIPGTEVTNQTGGYHILAVDVKRYVDPNNTVEGIIRRSATPGGHCHRLPSPSPGAGQRGRRSSRYLWERHEQYASLFDAWEVANRDDLFNAVGLKKYNYIANGDFHTRSHRYSWKTLIECPKNTEAIKQAVRDNTKASLYLFRGNQH